IADFNLNWFFNSSTGLSGSTPTIGFNNVTLRIGKFFDTFLGPIVKTIHEIFDPIKPVIDFLTDPIPVISDVSVLVGHGKIALEDIAVEFLPFLKPVQIFLDIVNVLEDIKIDGGSVGIPIGALHLDGTDVRSPLTDLTKFDNFPSNLPDLLVKFEGVAKGLAKGTPFAGSVDALFTKLKEQANVGLHFPLSENPTSALR